MQSSGFCRMDYGTTAQGISPSPFRRIKSWRLQPQKHALTEPPRWLCLHVLRFSIDNAGTAHESEVTIVFQAGEIIHVLYFVESTQFQWIPYQLMSNALNIGSNTRSGHYRGFLAEA